MQASWENEGEADVFQQTLLQAYTDTGSLQHWDKNASRALERTNLEKVFRKENRQITLFQDFWRVGRLRLTHQYSFLPSIMK